jgi:hypothetical protein
MPVPDERRLRADLDPVLDHLASGDAEVVVLEIRAPEARRLLHCSHLTTSLVVVA